MFSYSSKQKRPPIQAKLSIGGVNDRYEQEADRVANQVVNQPQTDQPIQRQCEDCEEEALQMKAIATSIPPIQRMEEEEETLQMKGFATGGEASPALEKTLQSSRGGGENLAENTRMGMEQSIGADFSQVRVHTDTRAIQMNRQLQARAFTTGNDIYFNSGEYQPENQSGKQLLAHELTHVVQQNGRGDTKAIQRSIYEPATGVSDPDAIIPVRDLIRYVEDVESSYPDDTNVNILTRIRRQYYDGLAFSQLIPAARTRELIGPGSYEAPWTQTRSRERRIYSGEVADETYDHLTARGDENAIGDNPSPYILLDNGEQIDLGHLLLGLEALILPRTSAPYSTYSIPNIDPASYVADLGIAAVWMEHHEDEGSPHDGAPVALASANLQQYYDMSAPEKDLLSDVDSFGTFEMYNTNTAAPLSQVLEQYYLGISTASVNYRWQIFCRQNSFTYTSSGNTVTWDNGVRDRLITRVNRFSDLYADGQGSAAWNALTGAPARGTHRHVPTVVDMFLAYVKQNLERELTP